MDMQKMKQYQYIPQMDFYPKSQYYKPVKIKNHEIYMYQYFEKAMLIIQLFSVHGQQKIVKKIYLELNRFCFMNQSREIVNYDCGSIKIWREDHIYNQDKFETILNGDVLSLVISQNDDLIVSSLMSGALLFWKKNIDWKHYQILQDDEWICLRNLNLNQKANILIAANTKKIYLFIRCPEGKQNEWSLKEKIKKKADELCFIDDAIFASIQQNENIITIYEVSAERKLFQSYILSGIPSSNISRFGYIQQKQFLLVKQTLFLIQKDCSGQYVLEQKLFDFLNNSLVFNQNGDYLLLDIKLQFNKEWRKIQLRKLVTVD